MVPSGSGVRISLVLFSFFLFYGFRCILYRFRLNLERLAISKSGDNDDGFEWNRKDGYRVFAYLCSLLEGIPYFQLPIIDICYLFFDMHNTLFFSWPRSTIRRMKHFILGILQLHGRHSPCTKQYMRGLGDTNDGISKVNFEKCCPLLSEKT